MNEIKIKSNVLASKLSVLGKAVSSKVVAPELECVKIERENAYTATLTTYESNELAIRTSILFEGEMEDDVLIPFAWLKSVCDSCKGAVTLKLTWSTSTKAISASTCDFVINGDIKSINQDLNDILKENYNGIKVHTDTTLDYNEFMSGYNCVSYATAKDEVRLIMTGVYVKGEDHRYCMYGTDGRMLAKSVRLNSAPIESGMLSAVIPHKIFGIMKAIGGHTFDIHCTREEEPCRIVLSGYDIMFKAVSGVYPNADKVIPMDSPNRAKVSRQSLMQAFKKAYTFGSNSGLVELRIKGNTLTLIASDYDSNTDIQIELPCVSNNDIRIGVCGVFAYTQLDTLEGDNVTICTADPSRPVIFKAGDESLTTLTMPMMLGDGEGKTPLERAILAQAKNDADEELPEEDEELPEEDEELPEEDEELPEEEENDFIEEHIVVASPQPINEAEELPEDEDINL